MTTPSDSSIDKPRHTPAPESGSLRWWTWDRALLLIVDSSLAAILLVAPLLMGGRHPIGSFVLVVLVVIGALAWMVRQSLLRQGLWRWTGAEWLLTCGLALIVFQLMPLPTGLLEQLSPTVTRLLPLWTESGDGPVRLGHWNQLSLVPDATRNGLVIYLAYGLLFLLVTQRIEKRRHIERFLQGIAIAGVLMAFVGLAQFAVGNGKFLWLYEHPFRSPGSVATGAFANRNHFAHFLALALGPLMWWLFYITASSRDGARRKRSSRGFGSWADTESRRTPHVIGLGLAVAAVIFAGLLSCSRGGTIALVLAATCSIVVFMTSGLSMHRRWPVFVGLGLLVVAALAIHGYRPLATRMATISESRSLDDLAHARQALWRAHLRIASDFPWFGAGVGSHRDIYRTYLDEPFEVEFTHGENGYLQVLVETGVIGLTMILTGIAIVLRWAARTWRHSGSHSSLLPYRALMGAIAAGLVTSLAHSAVDFVWYIPACMSVTVVLAACLCRCAQQCVQERTLGAHPNNSVPWNEGIHAQLLRRMAAGRSDALPRPVWWAGTAATCLLGAMMIHQLIPRTLASPAWDEYLRVVQRVESSGDAAASDREAVRQLRTILRHDPYDARASARLAAALLREFHRQQATAENPMDLMQIRDAALASQFASAADQERWLRVAVGDNLSLLNDAWSCSLASVRREPLLGESYLYLAKLAFLHSHDGETSRSLVAQAQRVRPYDGRVLLTLGQQAAEAGSFSLALEYWREAFRDDPTAREAIVTHVAPRLSASVFLVEFQPDEVALRQLFDLYRSAHRTTDARVVAQQRLARLVPQTRGTDIEAAAQACIDAAALAEYLDLSEQRLTYLRRAVQLTPDHLERRRALATALVEMELFEEANEHVRWCLRRVPSDHQLKEQMTAIRRGLLEHTASRPAPESEQPLAR